MFFLVLPFIWTIAIFLLGTINGHNGSRVVKSWCLQSCMVACT